MIGFQSYISGDGDGLRGNNENTGSALAGVLTDLIVLRDFTGALAFASAISITEITVASLPEPATLALLAVALATFATTRAVDRDFRIIEAAG